MKMYSLNKQELSWLAKQPESAMGLQLVQLPNGVGPNPIVQVVGGQVVLEQQIDNDHLVNLEPWMEAGTATEREAQFLEWLSELPRFDTPINKGRILRSRIMSILAGALPVSLVPNTVAHGHLPFVGTCGGGEVYYRWEPFPTSRRIDQKTGKISAGTFTAPASEVQFVASGFGAVGRFALPNTSPANWRWEIRPPSGTLFRCGASVPLYGQAGGGVEVEFHQGFANVGPIANPVVMPSL